MKSDRPNWDRIRAEQLQPGMYLSWRDGVRIKRVTTRYGMVVVQCDNGDLIRYSADDVLYVRLPGVRYG